MFRVFIYRHTQNLGDAIQTFCLCRLLNAPCFGVYRDEEVPSENREAPLIANGWLGRATTIQYSPNSIFAGIHVSRNIASYIEWIRSAPIVGARDPYTQQILADSDIKVPMVGCATMTLPRYRGTRSGRYSVDVGPFPGTNYLTNRIGPIDWSEQWKLAKMRLEQLRTAEVIYTNRLHVLLPCLAFGTPVIFPRKAWNSVFNKERMTIMSALGLEFDCDSVSDVSNFASTYRSFLETAIGIATRPTDDPIMPMPISDRT